MRRFVLMTVLLVGSLAAVAQPGELPKFTLPSMNLEPIDEVVMRIESLVQGVDVERLDVDTIRDSALYFQPYSPYASWQIEPSALPATFKPELIVYHREGAIEMIVFGKHTFHFLDGKILRSWVRCSQVTGMGLCGGFVTTSNTFNYWNGTRVYRTISWYSHPHPCGCYEENMYAYDAIMAIHEKAKEGLNNE